MFLWKITIECSTHFLWACHLFPLYVRMHGRSLTFLVAIYWYNKIGSRKCNRLPGPAVGRTGTHIVIGGESDEIQSNFWLSITKLVKPHVYGKRQTANVKFELRISQNRTLSRWKQLKTILMDKKLRESINLRVEITTSKLQVKGKLGHVLQIRVCRLT